MSSLGCRWKGGVSGQARVAERLCSLSALQVTAQERPVAECICIFACRPQAGAGGRAGHQPPRALVWRAAAGAAGSWVGTAAGGRLGLFEWHGRHAFRPRTPQASLPLLMPPPLQYPHRGVRELGFLPERHGIYVSRWHHGSPAHRYGLYALHWVSGEAWRCIFAACWCWGPGVVQGSFTIAGM